MVLLGLSRGWAGTHWIGNGSRVVAWTNDTPADCVRLGVRDEGVYRVAAGEIACAQGLPTNAVLAALAAGNYSLSSLGNRVVCTNYDDAVYFYGVPTTEMYAPENVYWLRIGAQGNAIETLDAAPEAGTSTNDWFWHTEAFRSTFVDPLLGRDKRSNIATLTNVLNFGLLVPGTSDAALRAKTKTVALPGFADSAPTGVWARVSVVSYADIVTPDVHTCEVWLDGSKCGSGSWTNERAITVDAFAPYGTVTNGPVQFTIRNGLTAQVNDFMLLEAWLTYPRSYVALSNLLVCTGGNAGTVAVNGLATNAIAVWDVTDANQPCALRVPVWQTGDGTWSTAFLCGGTESKYAVFGVPSGAYEPSVSGARDIDWGSTNEMPELAIVTPPRRWFTGFEEAVQPLVDFRNRQGLVTRIVDAEDIYNAFTHGIVHPGAFQRFSAAGVTNATGQRLRYMLFAGYGGSDYKMDAIGFGLRWPWVNYFPIYLYPQSDIDDFLLLPNDVVLGNATGDGAPEVAVGRFIATNTTELTRMIDKTIRYELTAAWKQKGAFVASTQLDGDTLDFIEVAARATVGFSIGGWETNAFYPDLYWEDTALNMLWYNDGDEPPTGVSVELAARMGLLYYFGHSSDLMLGVASKGVGCFLNATMLRSASWSFAPVAVLVGCRCGRWTLYDITSGRQCLAESGVRNPYSGFTAVVSASGFTGLSEAENFSDGFHGSVASGALRLGDAWCAAFRRLTSAQALSLQHMTLLGDPALVINPTRTARGTPTAWLIQEGLTNNANADFGDADGDGFPVWQEYQAGTDYSVSNTFSVLRFVHTNGVSESDSLIFQPRNGCGSRIVSTTNLASGVWETVPWKAIGDEAWSMAPIPGDWPVKTILVPSSSGDGQRYYKMESDDD